MEQLSRQVNAFEAREGVGLESLVPPDHGSVRVGRALDVLLGPKA